MAEKCEVPVFQHRWPEGPYENIYCPPQSPLWDLVSQKSQLSIVEFRELNKGLSYGAE